MFTGLDWRFAFDPCPFPVPPGFDGLLADWRAEAMPHGCVSACGIRSENA